MRQQINRLADQLKPKGLAVYHSAAGEQMEEVRYD